MSTRSPKGPGPRLRRAPLLASAGAAAGFAAVFGLHLGAAAPIAPPRAAAGQPTQPSGTGKVKSTGASSAQAGASTGGGTHSATGPGVNFGYGTIAVKVTVTGGRIVSVSVAKLSTLDPTSQQIAGQAIPMLRSEVLQAHSARIYGVSGATYTSVGYIRSLQAALDRLHAH